MDEGGKEMEEEVKPYYEDDYQALAKVRLQLTSNFKPDFENEGGGWIVFYNHKDRELYTATDPIADSGEPVRYATKEDALKSIRENERDWKIFFGIKEEE